MVGIDLSKPTTRSSAAACPIAGGPGGKNAVPVTLLSGFLGAGKTTLLKKILEQTHGAGERDTIKCAVLVNDMADLNIDASLVKNTKLMQQEEKLVELHNGCICCTLREDLVKALADLAAEGRFDAIVVESTGVSDPQEVAETFTYEVGGEEEGGEEEGLSAEEEAAKASTEAVIKSLRGAKMLQEVARLDTCVTVVDCASFKTNLNTAADVHDRFEGQVDEGDDRGVAPLLMSQIEFADVVVLNKSDLLNEMEAKSVEASVRALNPSAAVVLTSRGDVPLEKVLRTGLFDMQKAAEAPGWLQTMRGEPVTPETEIYNIKSFVYAARTPFHPKRLLDFFTKYFIVLLPGEDPEAEEGEDETMEECGDGECDRPEETEEEKQERAEEKRREAEEREVLCVERVAAMKADLGTVLRSKGFIWLAGRDETCGEWGQAGAVGELSCGGPWMHMLPEEALPPEGSAEHAQLMKDMAGPGVLKDRRQELVFIGQNMNEGAITAALDACLVTQEETRRRGRSTGNDEEHSWKLGVDYLDDPIQPWPSAADFMEEDDDGHGHNH